MNKFFSKKLQSVKKSVMGYFNHDNKYWKTGFAGMVILNIAHLPQLFKTINVRDVSGISLPFYLTLFTGLVIYLVYAIKRKDVIYIISNVSSLCQTGLMIIMILLFGGLGF